jgi:ribulose bisphosphate carboxylase small subunit
MLPKHVPPIPQNLLEYVNKKFVEHWMSKVWKYCSLKEKTNYTFSLKHCRSNETELYVKMIFFFFKKKKKKTNKQTKSKEREMTKFL